MTTGKTIVLTRWTFVGKVMSLLFNMLSRLVITFLPRSKRFLISWLQSSSAVILEPRKIKWATVSTVSPSICHEVIGLDPYKIINEYYMLSRFSRAWLFATSWAVAHQAPLTMGLPRQEYWSGFAISSSRRSAQPRILSYVSYIGRRVIYH